MYFALCSGRLEIPSLLDALNPSANLKLRSGKLIQEHFALVLAVAASQQCHLEATLGMNQLSCSWKGETMNSLDFSSSGVGNYLGHTGFW